MNNQAREGERYVLDILDTSRLPHPATGSAHADVGNPLMMQKFNSARYEKQKWFFTKVRLFKRNGQNVTRKINEKI